MGMTLSNRSVAAVAAVAGTVIAVGVHAGAAQPGAGQVAAGAVGRPTGSTVVQDATGTAAQAAAVRYWTPARMSAALRAADGTPTAKRPARRLIRKPPPAPRTASASWLTGDTAGTGLPWTHEGAVAAAVGKVFFTLGGEDYVCSGTLVGGKHPDVVLTAAHCVAGGVTGDAADGVTGGVTGVRGGATGGPGKGGATQWATNWMFVPGFADGLLPHGEYTARRFFVSKDWTGPAGGREQYDTAFVQVTAATVEGVSGPWVSGTAQPPPGLPVTFAGRQDTAPLSRTYVFGYPAELPYTGLYLSYCAGPAGTSGGSVRTPCGMTAGDSGGPWLAGFSPRSGGGQVVAVSTYKVSGNLRVLYGAVLGPQARALYERAVS
jgi:V8-like Glu-specific endopeptidase